ncbi:MAG: leucine-rich repeat protein [Alistipes sp.]|nr:leucine-rich repeat protein [Alistipes sp.]
MKNFTLYLLLLVGVLCAACQKSEIVETNRVGEQITLSASIDNGNASRVALTPSTDTNGNPIVKVDWNAGNESFRMWGDNSYENFIQVGSSNQFTGVLPESAYGQYWITYPADDRIVYGNGYSMTPITYDESLFTTQDGCLSEARTVLAGFYAPNYGPNITFTHATFLLKPRFKVDGELIATNTIRQITCKDMLMKDGTVDFEINCSALGEDDPIYIYVPNCEAKQYANDPEQKNTIEMVVITRDGKRYEGTITIPADKWLESGKLYTATVQLADVTPANAIIYTTSDNQPLPVDSMNELNGLYSSHSFENGYGTIVLNNGITELPGWSFYNRDGKRLTSIHLPSQIKTIGANAFVDCTGLTAIDLSHVTTICDGAFSSCENLAQITMPQNSYTIGSSAFNYCAAQEIDLTNVSSIDHYAFAYSTQLKTVIVNKTTPPAIYSTIFYDCTALESIYVPTSAVTAYKSSWSAYAAYIKPLEQRDAAESIIYTTTDDQQVTLALSNWISDDDEALIIDHTFTDGVGVITLKEGVTTLPTNAFDALYTLKQVYLPEEITAIGNYAFRYCKGLTEISMPGVTTIGAHAFNMEGTGTATTDNNLKVADLSKVTSFGEKAFYEAALSHIDLTSATSIGKKAFAMTTSLNSIIYPAQDCTLGGWGFARVPLEEIDLSAFSSLGKQALHACGSLKTVIINRADVPSNDGSMFDECSVLDSIYVPDASVDTYKNAWPAYASKIKAMSDKNPIIITYKADQMIQHLGGYPTSWTSDYVNTSSAWHTFDAATGTGTVRVKRGVTALPANAFTSQTGGGDFQPSPIRAITLPEEIKTIGEWAFWDCNRLEEIDLSHIERIEDNAFEGCTSLRYVYINNHRVSEIVIEIFSSCPQVTILVPHHLVDQYHDRWPEYADRINEGHF